MENEKDFNPISGYLMLILMIFITLGGIYSIVLVPNPFFIALFVVIEIFMAIGFVIIYPNYSSVLTLFGKYKGTIKLNGFHWVNPFFVRKRVSLRAQNFDSEKIKVNDKLGNPIQISVILVWKVRNTFKAAFHVNDYEHFVRVQSDAAVRKLAGSYPYDNFDDDQSEITLRSGLHEVNHALELELSERLEIAGIEVIEARIGYLAYAPEIANAMLRRQQATAIVAARLKKKEVVELDEERKAAMVSNLMVVLCSDKDASPIVNAGTLHH